MKARTLHYLTLLLLLGVNAFSQSNPSIKTDLPQIAPPSPTVAALMKFEEVPVNNYTGIPDISIPLYSVQSHSKDIGINLSLKYHPGSIAVEEEAGYTGLGWSLTGGGTISRTVRGGCADDAIDNDNKRYGIYYDTSINANPFYEVVAMNAAPYEPSSSQKYTRNKFYWEAFEKGKYDTQHDLYQFSFMGGQGRFYIKKNGTSPYETYEIIRLDNNNAIKIEYHGTDKTFTVYDDRGYKYIFDIKEITQESTFVGNVYFGNPALGNTSNVNYEYISAFHLSKIYDSNNKLLVEFKYNLSSEVFMESTSDVMTTRSYFHSTTQSAALLDLANSQCGNVQGIEPAVSSQNSTRNTKTKKIKQIRVFDKALINFTLADGGDDPDGPQMHRLKHITVHPWTDSTSVVKRFELFYGYSQVNYGSNPKKRLTLTKVSEIEPGSETNAQSYELYYTLSQYNLIYTKDHWGYFNRRPANNTTPGQYREATPGVCEIDALQKMTLPSGGAIVFNFESNTYSHIGNTALTNFDENPENWTYENPTLFFTPGHYTHTIVAENYIRHATFTPDSDVIDGQGGSYRLYYKDIYGNWQEYSSINCGENDGNCTTSSIELHADIEYKITFSWFNMVPGGGNVKVNFKYRNTNNFQYLFGGGIRIKEIGYFEDGEVPQYAFDLPHLNDYVPSKLKEYNYNFFDSAQESSGALVFPKPIYDYMHTKRYYMRCFTGEGLPTGDEFIFDFRTVNEYNNLKSSRTQGSDVGYKNVTVRETGNGYSQYEYKSPMDEPEASYTTTFPFLPNKNYDHRRGLITNEKHYREDNKQLTETSYQYTTVEGMEKTGFILFALNNCEFAHLYENYSAYGQGLDGCAGSSDICYACGVALEYITPFPVDEVFGWVKLTEKITKEHFYHANNTEQGVVETKETYDYYDYNKKIKSVTTETYTGSTPETVSQEFTYLNDASLLPINRIGDIETVVSKKNGVAIAAQKIVYANTYPGNIAWLPATVRAGKGNAASTENRVQFVKYDAWSNPLEVKLENGTPVCYIWGYNKTQPIAMIENTTYEQLATALSTTVENIRDNYDLLDLPNNDNLRSMLPNAMVTTYTYKPLVGVTSVTDPKGITITYEYDAMGRLKAVKDEDGNLLSENEYHYRMP